MTKMLWRKRGLIFEGDSALPWSRSHAQIPTVSSFKPGVLSIFYSSRDANNLSRIGRVDVDSGDPSKIIARYSAPVLELGLLGTFDDSGMMPSSIVKLHDRIFLYYIGWNVRTNVPYHNSVGLAVSDDGGESFRRAFEGPVMDRTSNEPFFCGTSCVRVEDGLWRNWYMSCTGWENVDGRVEPRYHLKYAESSDGVHWRRDGVIAIDYGSSDEGGIVRATVCKAKNLYQMWFSFRSLVGYRTNSSNSYRIGYAESLDGIKWVRKDRQVGIDVSEDGWDSLMLAYPEVVDIENHRFMFYNGNGFGLTGIGYAIAE